VGGELPISSPMETKSVNRILLFEHDAALGQWLEAVLAEAQFKIKWIKDVENTLQELLDDSPPFDIALIEGVTQDAGEKLAYYAGRKGLKTAIFAAKGLVLRDGVADAILEHPLTRTALLDVLNDLASQKRAELTEKTSNEPDPGFPREPANPPEQPTPDSKSEISSKSFSVVLNNDRSPDIVPTRDVVSTAAITPPKIIQQQNSSNGEEKPAGGPAAASATGMASWASAVPEDSRSLAPLEPEVSSTQAGTNEPETLSGSDAQGESKHETAGNPEPEKTGEPEVGATPPVDARAQPAQEPLPQAEPLQQTRKDILSDPPSALAAHSASPGSHPTHESQVPVNGDLSAKTEKIENLDLEPQSERRPAVADRLPEKVEVEPAGTETEPVNQKSGSEFHPLYSGEFSRPAEDSLLDGFPDAEIDRLNLTSVERPTSDSSLSAASFDSAVAKAPAHVEGPQTPSPTTDGQLEETSDPSTLPAEVSESKPLASPISAAPLNDTPPEDGDSTDGEGVTVAEDSEKEANVQLAMEKLRSGQLALKENRLDTAIMEIEAAEALRPDTPEIVVWARWARYLSLRDTVTEARQLQREIEESAHDWDCADSRYFAARLAADMGNLQSALAQASMSLQHSNAHESTQELLGELWTVLSETEE
jgi:hypothetical protein